MDIGALLASAGINTGLCVLFLSLYSVFRKQPANARVYFGRRMAEEHGQLRGAFSLERFVPSTGWIAIALQCSEGEILAAAGLDAVVFNRILLFNIGIFSIASLLCAIGIPSLSYFEQDIHHVQVPSESLDVRTIRNVEVRPTWLSVHCVYLYIISGVACILLYIDCKHIARLRLLHLTSTTLNPSHFTVLVRGIPKKDKESCSDVIDDFITKYHSSSYLFHRVIYKVGKVQKIKTSAKKAYKKFKHFTNETVGQGCRTVTNRGCLCQPSSNSFKLNTECEQNREEAENESSLNLDDEECVAAFVFFKTRYATIVASEILQTSKCMNWVANLAPEQEDVYWSNLCQHYKQLWIPRIGFIVFMFLFMIPVTFIQGLSQLEQLQQRLPFLKGILKNKHMSQLVTGYLPSVILQIFQYTVAPIMMRFSTWEGPTSHSERKRSACCKVMYFTVWNMFFFNILSGTVISQLNVLSNLKKIPVRLARAVPKQASFFITYVLTSGWVSLSSELLQLFGLIWNLIRKYVLRMREDTEFVPSFPYHTEIPKVLLFGLLGFTCSLLASLSYRFF